MFPPHRPALASTSNPAQIPSTSAPASSTASVAGIPLRTPELSPRIRKDATTVRYGCHLFDNISFHARSVICCDFQLRRRNAFVAFWRKLRTAKNPDPRNAEWWLADNLE
ncbi:unnamed protein product [Gongylonema pulchrum]|uniref:DUF1752 domain-containing protein n=1 Tax=Gongylonema pulchrum TaxID=637853 RepID=A0A183DCG1_9BILA|nr:unnamed protein product [Gongylonema pulchrum]